MKQITFILLFISIICSGQDKYNILTITPKKNIIKLTGIAGATTNFIVYDVKSEKDTYIKAGICIGCILFSALPDIIKSERIELDSGKIVIKFKKRKRCLINN